MSGRLVQLPRKCVGKPATETRFLKGCVTGNAGRPNEWRQGRRRWVEVGFADGERAEQSQVLEAA